MHNAGTALDVPAFCASLYPLRRSSCLPALAPAATTGDNSHLQEGCRAVAVCCLAAAAHVGSVVAWYGLYKMCGMLGLACELTSKLTKIDMELLPGSMASSSAQWIDSSAHCRLASCTLGRQHWTTPQTLILRTVKLFLFLLK